MLKRHVEGRVNETIERRNLRQRTQQVGESFDDYLVSLHDLTKTCNFCNNECLQIALCDQIIEGLFDGYKQYDRRAKPVTYQEGTRVMVFMPKETVSKNRKLALPYHGPYCVLEICQNCRDL